MEDVISPWFRLALPIGMAVIGYYITQIERSIDSVNAEVRAVQVQIYDVSTQVEVLKNEGKHLDRMTDAFSLQIKSLADRDTNMSSRIRVLENKVLNEP